MNDTIELLLSHRSIRSFADEPVPDEHIAAAVDAGQRASTSSAAQAYSLLQITDPDAREALVRLTGNQAKVVEAGAFFVVLADTRRHRLAAARRDLPYDTRLEAFVVATVDASLFAQNMVVAFESLGYGICYVGGLRNDLDAVDALLELPEGVYPLFGLCVGVPAQEPIARPRLPHEAVWMKDRYAPDAEVHAALEEYDARYRDYLRQRGARPADWSEKVARAHARPTRAYLARFYEGKGARLD